MDMYDEIPVNTGKTTAQRNTDSRLTPESIKAEISYKLYTELTNEDDHVTENCIESALIRAESLLHILKTKLSINVPIQRRIVKLLAIYELYVYNGDEKGGHEYLKAATELVSDTYGSVETARTQGNPAGAIQQPKRRKTI